MTIAFSMLGGVWLAWFIWSRLPRMPRRSAAPLKGFSTLPDIDLKMRGWVRGLSGETQAKLLGYSLSDTWQDLPLQQERERAYPALRRLGREWMKEKV